MSIGDGSWHGRGIRLRRGYSGRAPRPCVLALAALGVLLFACDEPGPTTCVTSCGAPPGEAECGIVWTLDEGCAGYVDEAEIAVDQCLEPVRIRPGEEIGSCARVPRGAEFTWTVRAEKWQWGPWKDACATGGGFTLVYDLSCR